MKNSLSFLLLVVFLSTTLVGQNNQNSMLNIEALSQIEHPLTQNGLFSCDPDSVVVYNFSSPVDSSFQSRAEITYYEFSRVSREYNNEVNGIASYDSLVIDATGNIVFQELSEWSDDSMAVILESRILNFWNPVSLKLDSSITWERGFSNGIFGLSEKLINTYGAGGEILLETNEYLWSTTNMSWEFSAREAFFYKTATQLDSSITYFWNGSEIVSDLRYEYTYYPNDSLSSKTSYEISSGDPFEKEEHVFDDIEFTKTSTGYAWESDSLDWLLISTTFTDKDELNRTVEAYTIVDFLGFTFGFKLEYNYIEESTCVNYIDIFDALDEKTWIFNNRAHFYPKQIKSNNSNMDLLDINMYPNPNNGSFTVEAELGTKVTGIDLLGRTIFSFESSGVEQVQVPIDFQGWLNIICQKNNKTIIKKLLIVD